MLLAMKFRRINEDEMWVFFFIDNSNIVVITVVLKTDHTSKKWERTPQERSIFLRFKQQIPISVLFCQGTQETVIHFFWGCRVTRAWKDFLVSVDWLKASSVLDTDIVVSHCVLWVRFYIFSCKYKSSKPSIVEYIYQVKDNFIIEEQISIIKGKEKNFEEKRKQIIQKRRLFEWALLSSLLKKKNYQNYNVPTFRWPHDATIM